MGWGLGCRGSGFGFGYGHKDSGIKTWRSRINRFRKGMLCQGTRAPGPSPSPAPACCSFSDGFDVLREGRGRGVRRRLQLAHAVAQVGLPARLITAAVATRRTPVGCWSIVLGFPTAHSLPLFVYIAPSHLVRRLSCFPPAFLLVGVVCRCRAACRATDRRARTIAEGAGETGRQVP